MFTSSASITYFTYFTFYTYRAISIQVMCLFRTMRTMSDSIRCALVSVLEEYTGPRQPGELLMLLILLILIWIT